MCRTKLAGMVKKHKSMTTTLSVLLPPVSGRPISIEAPLKGTGGSATASPCSPPALLLESFLVRSTDPGLS